MHYLQNIVFVVVEREPLVNGQQCGWNFIISVVLEGRLFSAWSRSSVSSDDGTVHSQLLVFCKKMLLFADFCQLFFDRHVYSVCINTIKYTSDYRCRMFMLSPLEASSLGCLY